MMRLRMWIYFLLAEQFRGLLALRRGLQIELPLINHHRLCSNGSSSSSSHGQFGQMFDLRSPDLLVGVVRLIAQVAVKLQVEVSDTLLSASSVLPRSGRKSMQLVKGLLEGLLDLQPPMHRKQEEQQQPLQELPSYPLHRKHLLPKEALRKQLPAQEALPAVV